MVNVYFIHVANKINKITNRLLYLNAIRKGPNYCLITTCKLYKLGPSPFSSIFGNARDCIYMCLTYHCYKASC